MKKMFIAIISMMMLMPALADAQIHIAETYGMTVSSARMGHVSLELNEAGVYYLCMHTMNEYEPPILLRLGDSKVSAMESLLDLLDIYKSKKSQYIESGYYGLKLFVFRSWGALNFSSRIYDKSANIGIHEIKKFANALR